MPSLLVAISSSWRTRFKKASSTSLLAPGLAAERASAAHTAALSTQSASTCPW